MVRYKIIIRAFDGWNRETRAAITDIDIDDNCDCLDKLSEFVAGAMREMSYGLFYVHPLDDGIQRIELTAVDISDAQNTDAIR